jgi:hypothetical protein
VALSPGARGDAPSSTNQFALAASALAGPARTSTTSNSPVAEYIDWFNFRRLHGEIGLVPPVEHETQHRSNTLPEQPAHRQFEVSIKPGT